MPPAQGGAEGSVRLLLTKNPAHTVSCRSPRHWWKNRGPSHYNFTSLSIFIWKIGKAPLVAKRETNLHIKFHAKSTLLFYIKETPKFVLAPNKLISKKNTPSTPESRPLYLKETRPGISVERRINWR